MDSSHMMTEPGAYWATELLHLKPIDIYNKTRLIKTETLLEKKNPGVIMR